MGDNHQDANDLPEATAEMAVFHQRPPDPPGAHFRADQVYGTAGAGGRELTLDLYARTDPSTRRPGVLFVHGGGWAGGSTSFHLRQAHALAARGWVGALVRYRLHPEARWPDPLEDVKCAMRWLRANADAIGLDHERVAVCGGSAGGHLAAMLALTPGLFEGGGGNPAESSAAQAAVLFYPAIDLPTYVGPGQPEEMRPIQQILADMLGEPLAERAREAAPLSYVSAHAPPTLTMTGTKDWIAPPEMLSRFHRALDDHGVQNRLEVFEGAEHAFDLATRSGWDATFKLLSEFLEEHLGEIAKAPGRSVQAAPA